MDIKGVITLVFVLIILAVGLAIAISKYIIEKRKNKELTLSVFLAKYGTNVLVLLKDVYEIYIKDNIYPDENELIKDLVDHSIETIKDQFAKYEIDSELMKILSEDLIKQIITSVVIEAKDQIINIVNNNNNKEDTLEPISIPRETEEEYYSSEEEPEVVEQVSLNEAKEMIDLENEFKTYLNEEDYKYAPAENEDIGDNDKVDI